MERVPVSATSAALIMTNPEWTDQTPVMSRRSVAAALLGTCIVSWSGMAFATDEPFPISQDDTRKIPTRFQRRVVTVDFAYRPGTIVVDTSSRYLYLTLGGRKAMRYGIGVGRQGFSWSGRAVIRRKAKWPTWTPPPAMVTRDEFAAKWANGMPGGPQNPLGARALYLYQGNRDTLYRIHGTTVPSSIGRAVSSGCIRMLNADVADLYNRVTLGTEVIVLQKRLPLVAEEMPPQRRSLFDLFR